MWALGDICDGEDIQNPLESRNSAPEILEARCFRIQSFGMSDFTYCPQQGLSILIKRTGSFAVKYKNAHSC